MPAIVNPNPVTPGVCNQYWIESLTLTGVFLSARLKPCDGQHVVGNASLAKRVTVQLGTDTAAEAAAGGIFAALQALSGDAAAVQLVSVNGADPLAPVSVQCLFATKAQYRIADLFTTLAGNVQAAAAYEALLAYLAGKVA